MGSYMAPFSYSTTMQTTIPSQPSSSFVQTLSQNMLRGLSQLAEHPVALYIVTLGLNAVLIPYSGLYHDSMLYGVQTLNQVYPGHFQNDLFLKYGSQDKFSLFSTMAAPLTEWLGLYTAFHLIYIVSNALLLYAVQRLMFLIAPNRSVATAACLYFAITAMSFGEFHILHINEPFTTPRLPSAAFTILSLSFAIQGNRIGSLWIIPAMALHPIMAIGGFICIIGLFLWNTLGSRWFVILGLAGLAGLTVVLSVSELGISVFGRMSPEWKAEVLRLNRYNFPMTWTWESWLQLGSATGLLIYGITRYTGIIHRLLILILITGLGGLALTEIATHLPYARLFQAQPYRAVWLIHLTQIPIAIDLIVRLWNRSPLSRAGAVVLFGYSVIPLWNPVVLVLAIMVLLPTFVGMRGLQRIPQRLDWLAISLLIAIIGAAILLFAIHVTRLSIHWHTLYDYSTPELIFNSMANITLPISGGIAIYLMLTLCVRSTRYVIVSGLALWIITNTFIIPVIHPLDGRRSTFDFVNLYLATHPQPHDRTPTMYFPGWEWKFGAVDYIWFELRWNNFYAGNQLAGNIFNKDNAMEGKRRISVASLFELPYFLHIMRSKKPKIIPDLLQYSGYDSEPPPPTVADLRRLCQEPDLDLVVIPFAFPGLYAATNGTWYIYEPEFVRTHPDINPDE